MNARVKRLGVCPEAVHFQPDAAALLHQPLPLMARAALYALLALVASALGFAYFAKVDKVVDAQGRLTTTARPQVAKPASTAILRQVFVREGDRVAKGQVLATLDPTFSKADVMELASRMAYVRALEARLMAELHGLQTPDFPAPDAPHAQSQAMLLAKRRAEHQARLISLDQQRADVREMIEANQGEQERLAEQEAVLLEIESMHKTLYDKDVGSRMEFLRARHERQKTSAALGGARDEGERLAEQKVKADSDKRTYLRGREAEIAEQLAQAREEMAEMAQKLAKAARMDELVVLKANRDSIVQHVAEHSEGSVISQGSPFITLVPLDSDLIAEVRIGPKDIGLVREGQAVRVKLDAFPFQRHGVALGELAMVSPDSSHMQGDQEETQDSYIAKIRLTDAKLHRLPQGAGLKPGMTVTAEINVGRRRVMDYFLDPLQRGLDESFREP